MEELNLFEELDVPTPLPSAPPKKKKKLPPDTDTLFWAELQRWKPLCRTVEQEIAFLTTYLERFKFEGDRKRLNTLKHYLYVYQQSEENL
jgi:hypothetical protein